jgi:hypothetical protein
MDRLSELIAVLSDRKVQARTLHAKLTHICKICKRPAIAFKNGFSEYEYGLSTICEDCQIYFYESPSHAV